MICLNAGTAAVGLFEKIDEEIIESSVRVNAL